MKQTMRGVVVFVCVMVLCGLHGGCSSAKQSKISTGTTPVGLPPVSADIAPEVYIGDAYLSEDCDSVPSGLRNCQDILRREARQQLIQVLEAEVDSRFQDVGSSEIGEGGFAEQVAYLTDLTETIAGHLMMRTHESPIFHLDDEQSYGLRLLVVREELDYTLWTEIAQSARAEGRDDTANVVEGWLAVRYDGGDPDQKKIKQVEKDIANHFTEMWDRAQEQKKGQRAR